MTTEGHQSWVQQTEISMMLKALAVCLQVKPSVLIGLSGAGRLFTQEILEVRLFQLSSDTPAALGDTLCDPAGLASPLVVCRTLEMPGDQQSRAGPAVAGDEMLSCGT